MVLRAVCACSNGQQIVVTLVVCAIGRIIWSDTLVIVLTLSVPFSAARRSSSTIFRAFYTFKVLPFLPAIPRRTLTKPLEIRSLLQGHVVIQLGPFEISDVFDTRRETSSG